MKTEDKKKIAAILKTRATSMWTSFGYADVQTNREREACEEAERLALEAEKWANES